MSALRFSKRLLILLLLSASPSLAQNEFQSGTTPVPAVKGGSEFEIGVGYSHLTMNLSGKPTVNLSGADTSATINFHPRWGATVDSTYVRAPRDAGSRHSSAVFSALAGPVFVAAQNDKTRLLIRALAGVSVVDSSVPVNQLYYRGWFARFSWAVGTGIERNLSGPFAARVNVDYLRTKFMSTAGVVQPQNDIRLSAGLVFRFGARRQTR